MLLYCWVDAGSSGWCWWKWDEHQAFASGEKEESWRSPSWVVAAAPFSIRLLFGRLTVGGIAGLAFGRLDVAAFLLLRER